MVRQEELCYKENLKLFCWREGEGGGEGEREALQMFNFSFYVHFIFVFKDMYNIQYVTIFQSAHYSSEL
jgi:hypothetical protein